MRIRLLLAATLTLAGLGAIAPASAVERPITVTPSHACTHTSSGSCIRGGEFCPQSSYGHSGWDAYGRRYVCKGSRTHPHWEKP